MIPLRLIASLLIGLVATQSSGAEPDDAVLEQLAGTFELESGERISGGPFVERYGDTAGFLYLDTQGLGKGGLFRQKSSHVLESVQPAGISIRFTTGDDGVDRLVWTGPEGSVEGRRIRPHDARSVAINSDGADLKGRMLVPKCPGPHPLVVMVGGSGPTTRWGGVFDSFFVSLGMAVLTYDKRGAGDPNWSEPDIKLLATDAASALRMGTADPEIDADRAGLWASSQGGWVAPIAAAEAGADFLIVRVGPGVSELETLLHELRQETRAKGLSGIDLDHASALRRKIYELAVEGRPLSATDALVAPFLNEDWYVTAFGEGPLSKRWSERWWHRAQRNLSVEPGPYLVKLEIPILWFLAGRDENVPLVPSQVRLHEAFAASPGRDETLVTIANANHAFLVRQPDSSFRYAQGFFSRMRAWLAVRGLSDEGCWQRG